VVIKFKIARRYRGGHPRFYLAGGMATDVTAQNTWTPAYQSAVAAAWVAFINACVLAPPASLGVLAQVNVSYFSGFVNKTFPSMRTHPVPVLRAVPLQDTVLGASTNPKVASQRRRNLQSP
jgi:hypothetical protein